MAYKWNFEIDEKTDKIYQNMCNQIDKVFRHTRQGSYETRYRYKDGVKHFAKYMAEAYKKQNLNRIRPAHLEGYVEQMQESGYSKSYVTTNLSAVRYFYDQLGKNSKKLPTNRELGVNHRTKEDRIGKDRAWTDDEVTHLIEYAKANGEERFANMIRLGRDHGLRIHEVTRLDKTDLKHALNEGKLTVKGKGGLIRKVPLNNESLVKELYVKTPPGEKVFVRSYEKTHEVIKKMQNYIYQNRANIRTSDDESSRRLTFHGLRHSYAQQRFDYYSNLGFNEKQAQQRVAIELGHFRPEITDVYLKRQSNL